MLGFSHLPFKADPKGFSTAMESYLRVAGFTTKVVAVTSSGLPSAIMVAYVDGQKPYESVLIPTVLNTLSAVAIEHSDIKSWNEVEVHCSIIHEDVENLYPAYHEELISKLSY
jgi:hypothetical protein